MLFGYKASAEQFGPVELLDFSVGAEELGFDSVAVSDHFQPWRHSNGHAPNSLVWLGAAAQATRRAQLLTSVLTPTMRYHPAIVAQSFATAGCIAPGRVILGVGSGEAMNEVPATATPWPAAKERRLRLGEAIRLIKELWAGERVTFDGAFYSTDKATIYDKPEQPIPVYVAASGPLAAKLVGRVGDGFITTSGKKPELYAELLENVTAGAEAVHRDPDALVRTIEIKVSYDRDPDYALRACDWWAALALTPDEKSGIDDPIEMEQLADAHLDRAHTRFIVSSDPEECAAKIWWYVDQGFEHLLFHAPGTDQARFIEQFSHDVLGLLRTRAGREHSVSR